MDSKARHDSSTPKVEGSSGTQSVFDPTRNINPNSRITLELLNGKNYKGWSYYAKMANGSHQQEVEAAMLVAMVEVPY